MHVCVCVCGCGCGCGIVGRQVLWGAREFQPVVDSACAASEHVGTPDALLGINQLLPAMQQHAHSQSPLSAAVGRTNFKWPFSSFRIIVATPRALRLFTVVTATAYWQLLANNNSAIALDELTISLFVRGLSRFIVSAPWLIWPECYSVAANSIMHCG